MDFGMPTLLETQQVEQSVSLCRELGLTFVELNQNLPAFQTASIDPDRFLAAAEGSGVYYTLHLDERLDPFDFNPRIASACLDSVLDAATLARRLSAPVLNLHLSRGVYFTLPGRKVYLYREHLVHYLASVRAFRDRCDAALSATGVRICIENTDGYQDFQLSALDLLLESPVFSLTFDVGHDWAIGGGDSAHILARASRLSHMHLHDCAGTSAHLPLGAGEIDIPACLALAEAHSCRVVLETKTSLALRASVESLSRP